ncbi:unnamed protein product [Staurois parvus]|uniref:Uncharacterized protein n=1 Tax=Staurois parvus TaxID=386267 RepID=A0ABN9FF97_9NEOB|nr:unnamed protein product [Staurois parvus]
MRCPGTFFISFFEFGQGHRPHDPLLPGGPMSCQSTPGSNTGVSNVSKVLTQGYVQSCIQ